MGQKLFLTAVAASFVALVAHRVWQVAPAVTEAHQHALDARAGEFVALGGDRYHVEVLFTSDGMLKLYTLQRDARQPLQVPMQTLTAYLTPDGSLEAWEVLLNPRPQQGDPPGGTSRFGGTLPEAIAGQPLRVSIPGLAIGRQRFHLAFGRRAASAQMPLPVGAEEERELYLTAGGKYTVDDIAANGRAVPSQVFRGFQARHDHDPQPGDQLCPISRTKANPQCRWVVGSRAYEFCCPPCIDEFVRLAKEQPEKALPPEDYVQH